ncbi:MAG TPA: hypothetical protein VHA37_08160 [Candidatus Saccharimonadales bacterium]|nr:hypothetical protein [Candidatus Saccharimonadales bacterium]
MGAPERWVTDSAAHPIIGYVGAWAASRAAGKSAGNLKAGAGLAVVTAANFFTESMQSATVATGQYIEFWSSRNAPETLKDYAFALAGLGLFMWQERRGGYGEPEVSAD